MKGVNRTRETVAKRKDHAESETTVGIVLSKFQIAYFSVFQSLSALSAAVTVILPIIALQFSVSVDDVVAVNTLYMLGFSLGLPIMSSLMYRFTFMKIVISGTLLYAAAALAATVMESFIVFLGLRLVQGIAASVLPVSAAVLGTMARARTRRSLANGMSIMVVVTQALSPLVGGWLAEVFTWKLSVALPAVSAIILLPLAISLRNSHLLNSRAKQRKTALPSEVILTGIMVAASILIMQEWISTIVRLTCAIVTFASLLLLLLVVFQKRRSAKPAFISGKLVAAALFGNILLAVSSAGSISFALYMSEDLHFNTAVIGLLAAAAVTVSFVLVPLGARLLPKIGMLNLLKYLCIASALAISLVAMPNVPVLLRVVALGVITATFGTSHSVLIQHAQELMTGIKEGDADYRTMGVFQLIYYSGGAFGAAIFGSLVAFFNITTATIYLSVVPLTALLISIMMRSTLKRRGVLITLT